jgi:hypothetical protein
MAKVQSENIVITVSKLVKDNETDGTSMVSDEVIAALEQVAQELIGGGVVVEVNVA